MEWNTTGRRGHFNYEMIVATNYKLCQEPILINEVKNEAIASMGKDDEMKR